MATYSANMYINGEVISDRKRIDVISPVTGEACGNCAVATEQDVKDACSAAAEAFKTWKNVPLEERVALMQKAKEAILPKTDEIKKILAIENGKPPVVQEVEVGVALAVLDLNCMMAPEAFKPEEIAAPGFDASVVTGTKHQVPIGAVAAISPWNFPWTNPFMKVVPTILAGNCVVFKPSPFTPLVTLIYLQEMAKVLPKGVLNLIGDDGVMTDRGMVATWLTGNPDIKLISMTGSTGTGKKIMAAAAADLKRVHLELGGNDVALVLPSFPIDTEQGEGWVKDICWGAFGNTGQICANIKRVYVHESMYDKFMEKAKKHIATFKVGDPHNADTMCGPLATKMQLEIVEEMIKDSVAQGATIEMGGKRIQGGGFFHENTLMSCKGHERIVLEEQFGPVMPVVKYTDVNEALRMCNDNENGLNGSVWGDKEEATKFAAQLESGTQLVNAGGGLGNQTAHPAWPFGGVKQSGIGRDNGIEGLREHTHTVMRVVRHI